MGARAKQRLAAGAAAALTLALGIAVLVLATSSSSNSHRAASRTSKEIYGTFGAFGITDGMRGSELLARLGPPDERRNGCWIYSIEGKTFHGFTLAPQLTDVDAVRYCIYYGVVSIIEDHWRPISGVPPWGHPWAAPVSYGCGGKPCHHQGS